MTSPRLASNRIIPLLCLCGAVLFWGVSFMTTKTAALPSGLGSAWCG